jgi:GT2 family glycosyltransferase
MTPRSPTTRPAEGQTPDLDAADDNGSLPAREAAAGGSAKPSPAGPFAFYDISEIPPATACLWRSDARFARPPKVSILVPTLDGADLLGRMLESFAATNTYRDFEFIVVDHGSGDGTLALLRSWAERLPIRILARGANYSFSESNNLAARLASGELLLLLNNDMVFTGDALPPMVDALADERVGAVGLKQYEGLPTSMEPRRVYHLGVRLDWNLNERRLRPFHVRPTPIDARVMVETARFPAVTASVMLCRRADYLEVGGLSEDYVYGLEDVDFCCKLRWRLGKQMVSVNSVFAFHPKNTTRNRDAENRRPQEKANRRVLQHRCGYALRREFLAQIAEDDGWFTGRRLAVGIAVAPMDAETNAEVHAAWRLGEALRDLYGWTIRYLAPEDWAEAGGMDLYIATRDEIDIRALKDVRPHLTAAALITGEEGPWTARPWFDRFDIQLRASPEGAKAQAKALHDRLAERAGAFKVAIKSADGEKAPELAALRQALSALGCVVRVDAPDAWYGPASLADDVALILPGSAAYRPSSDQINLRLTAAPEAAAPVRGGRKRPSKPLAADEDRFAPSVLDVSAPKGRGVKAQARKILAAIERNHRELMLGPQDTPLHAALEAVRAA